ncbi:hypothetical protein DNTS_003594 [Danionella cerebrum]|uniref:Adenylyl cyclase-associated protein n=1 Tax=Danionella cerebrum TaxID=2873325 RepID=A0A553RHQ3_9TELE|nr:hypothetical protein DNTS_003594 [Danionella translucida]
MEGLVERLECAVLRLESVAAKLQSCSGAMINGEIAGILNGGESHSIDAFDHLLNSSVSDYLKVSSVIGGDVAKHAEMVHSALQCQKPGLYVKEMNDAAMFYTNRVLKDYKDTEPQHVEWVRCYLSIWSELQNFIREHHCTGLVWCKTPLDGLAPRRLHRRYPVVPSDTSGLAGIPEKAGLWPGADMSKVTPGRTSILNRNLRGFGACVCQLLLLPLVFEGCMGLSAPPSLFSDVASSSSSLSPPPPPPESSPSLSSSHHSALFAQLNQGEQITRGLKHVSDEQKSHKNPNLRCEDPQERPPHKQNLGSSSSVSSPPKHNPVLELEGKKWRVEHQQGSSALLIEETELHNCKKLGLVFDNVVGIVEIINSRDIQLQVNNNMNMFHSEIFIWLTV